MHESLLAGEAQSIWSAGVDAAKPAVLFRDQISVDGLWICFQDQPVNLDDFDRIVVLGAGKASAAMAIEFERQCLSQLPPCKEIVGWINAPQGTFDPEQSGKIRLHAARPPGINAPTAQAVAGTEQIMDLARQCGPRDLCVVLLSGGGSALLVAPIENVSLADKQWIARQVAAAGGNIEQLNAIRRCLSAVKGGKLAHMCGAGRMVTLIISDVLGDPLETIASGPTYQSRQNVNAVASQAIRDLGLDADPLMARLLAIIERQSRAAPAEAIAPSHVSVTHVILANNATAVDAAGRKAVELGYRYLLQSARSPEGDVAQVAGQAAAAIGQLLSQRHINCWISGGEPTVKLPAEPGLGGRNQQLALLTMIEMEIRRSGASRSDAFAYLSGGTDGEDGPTDAAGAWIDQTSVARATKLGLVPQQFASRAESYAFFDALGGIMRTGPTGTNVCDLRIALVSKSK